MHSYVYYDLINAIIHNISQVIRIQVNKEDAIDELYSNDGKQLHFGSVAVRYQNSLLIGTVNSKLLLCELRSLDNE